MKKVIRSLFSFLLIAVLMVPLMLRLLLPRIP